VTLLFADVEGSTKLLNALGERFGPARARMRELVREAARAQGGAEVDWAGDGVFLAFPRARDAVSAAAQIHRALASEPWPDDEAHRLRIGLHTGEPELGAEGYVGMDVVIAARICGAAHGEQVVVSQATRDVSGDAAIPEASYRPLGRHRLKDVPGAVQLFQLIAPGLREDFPPLKTLTATSLPALHHRLVGRADALAQVETLLDEAARLVTITGPGGAGKSRLALEVAAGAALDRPVHLVGLAPITDADLLPSAIARALGVRESARHDLVDAVADRLEGTSALLYLDNLEHLAAAPHVAALLDRAPDLQVLATSRTPLRLSTERVLPLEPLSVDDATTLFVELAAARGVVLREDALASVQEICRRLDGLPLAIELVAARLVVLPPAEIVRALEEGLALEMEGPVDLPERQRTLRAAIDWSYGRLTDSQRLLHGTLAVFRDSAALDDARALAPQGSAFLSDLEALVGWSLVRSETGDGSVRLSMLETVREHALAHLAAQGALDDARARHAERFIQLAREAEPHLTGPDQALWLTRLEGEFDNLAAAFEWLLASDRYEDALLATNALERFWRAEAHVVEAKRWLSQGLAAEAALSVEVRALSLRALAHMEMGQSKWEAAAPMLEQAIALFRQCDRPYDEVVALGYLSFVALRRDDPDEAESLGAEALRVANDLGDERTTAFALMAMADVDWVRQDFATALERYDEAVALSRVTGDPLLVVDAVYNSGMAAFQAGEGERGQRAFEEALVLARELHDAPHTAAARFMLAELAVLDRDGPRAIEHARDGFDLYTELGDDRSRARCLVVLSGAAVATGDYESAARLLGAAGALRGPDPVDAFETAVLDLYAAELEHELGPPRVADLAVEGVDLERTLTAAEVVSGQSEE
jgi:predicted ATPase/class 3 adenylate cyclase